MAMLKSTATVISSLEDLRRRINDLYPYLEVPARDELNQCLLEVVNIETEVVKLMRTIVDVELVSIR